MIGVFDSGVGGLTVVRALWRALPEMPLLYLGDTARVPYGIRSVETVRDYAREAAAFLKGARVDGVVVACNTVSATALDVFAAVGDGPLVGVVAPGVEAALAATQTGRVGVIGTQATIGSDAYGQRLRAARPDAVVTSIACPLFVPLAEEGWTDGDVPLRVAERYLRPLIEAKVDTIVLGCTHYPLLAEVIGQVAGPRVRLVDSAQAVAQAVASSWPRRFAEGPASTDRQDRFCVTDAGGSFREVAARFLGRPLPALETVHLGAAAVARPA